MILCASGLRAASAVGDSPPVVRLAGDAGFDGVAISADCPSGHVSAVAAAALAAGMTAPVMAAPLSEGRLDGGRRLPYLAALEDPDERRAALAQFTAMLELAVPLGFRHLTLYLGDVPLAAKAPPAAYRFARRELLDEDEAGGPLWKAALGERRAISGLVVDACRTALDRILLQAERRDVAISIELAGGPWASPSPREALVLLEEYASAPLGVVWDEGRMQVLTTLGIAPAPRRAVALAERATVWRANEAVGAQAGYLPGLGDPPAPSFASGGGEIALAPRPGIPIVVSGQPDSTLREVVAARLKVAAAVSEATAAAAKAAAAASRQDGQDGQDGQGRQGPEEGSALDRLRPEQRR